VSDVVRDAAEDARQHVVRAHADDDQVGLPGIRELDERLGRVPETGDGLGGDAVLGEPGGRVLRQ
jgi:hypothetical protein